MPSKSENFIIASNRCSIGCIRGIILHQGLLYHILVLISQVWSDEFLQPFGPKMCVTLCYNTPDCAVSCFDKVQLTCLLDSTGSRRFGERLYMKKLSRPNQPNRTANASKDVVRASPNRTFNFDKGFFVQATTGLFYVDQSMKRRRLWMRGIKYITKKFSFYVTSGKIYTISQCFLKVGIISNMTVYFQKYRKIPGLRKTRLLGLAVDEEKKVVVVLKRNDEGAGVSSFLLTKPTKRLVKEMCGGNAIYVDKRNRLVFYDNLRGEVTSMEYSGQKMIIYRNIKKFNVIILWESYDEHVYCFTVFRRKLRIHKITIRSMEVYVENMPHSYPRTINWRKVYQAFRVNGKTLMLNTIHSGLVVFDNDSFSRKKKWMDLNTISIFKAQ